MNNLKSRRAIHAMKLFHKLKNNNKIFFQQNIDPQFNEPQKTNRGKHNTVKNTENICNELNLNLKESILLSQKDLNTRTKKALKKLKNNEELPKRLEVLRQLLAIKSWRKKVLDKNIQNV